MQDISPPKHAGGAPKGSGSLRSPEVEREIFDRLAKGESLLHVCKFNRDGSKRERDDFYEPRFPGYDAIATWRKNDPEFDRQFARARDIGFDALADECLAIADTEAEDPAGRRVRVETRLKLLACWAPHRYGARLSLDGKLDTGAPTIILKQAHQLTQEERAAAFEHSDT